MRSISAVSSPVAAIHVPLPASDVQSQPAEEQADTREKCTILFGTQTGTAERFAKSLRAQLEGRYGGSTAFEVLDIEQYDAPAQLPKEKLVLLLMATYGDGDPTDSATDFWTWLSEAADSGDDLLQASMAALGAAGHARAHAPRAWQHWWPQQPTTWQLGLNAQLHARSLALGVMLLPSPARLTRLLPCP
jgi:sulfite reductase alpha subunit-like flavoprotein